MVLSSKISSFWSTHIPIELIVRLLADLAITHLFSEELQDVLPWEVLANPPEEHMVRNSSSLEPLIKTSTWISAI
jgi:hypothetical protein